MREALRFLARAWVLAAAALSGLADGAELCKNHYILKEPIACAWQRVADLHVARTAHTATLLRDGSVLVVGGVPANEPRSVERYDPATGTWRVVAPLHRARSWHAATLLQDGRVLVIGGESPGRGEPTARPEIYDPVADRWTLTAPVADQRARWHPTLTLLADGRVLVAGGADFDGWMISQEIYDPRLDAWSPAGELQQGRYGLSATPLRDGRILLAGGVDDDWLGTSSALADLYHPEAGRFTATGMLQTSRAAHQATLLPDGNVMVSGGWESFLQRNGRETVAWMSFATVGAIEVYDVGTGTWLSAPALQERRYAHTVTRLKSGALLIVGGLKSFGNVPRVGYTELNAAEIRAEASTPSVAAAELNEARFQHTATLLDDGSVLVVGGSSLGRALSSVELFLAVPQR